MKEIKEQSERVKMTVSYNVLKLENVRGFIMEIK